MEGIDLREILGPFVIVLSAITALSLYGRKLRLDGPHGLLLAGVLIGPSVLDLVSTSLTSQLLAELGVAFVMFTVGLEFQLEQAKRMWRTLLIAGTTQLVGTLAIAMGIVCLFGESIQTAFILGVLLAMSSTVLVVRALEENGTLGSNVGRVTVLILIFQDLAVLAIGVGIPTPNHGALLVSDPWLQFIVGATVVVLVTTFGGLVLERLFVLMTRSGSRDAAVLVPVLLAVGGPWVLSTVGLSFGISGFVVGLAASRSPHTHVLLYESRSIRNVLRSWFFIAIGLLVNVELMLENALLVAASVVAVVVVKLLTATLASLLSGRDLRDSVRVGGALAQVGELSFVLASGFFAAGMLEEKFYQLFLAVAIITMVGTPLVMSGAERMAQLLPEVRIIVSRENAPAHGTRPTYDAILIGYGPHNCRLADELSKRGVSCVIVDPNDENIPLAKAAGYNFQWGFGHQVGVLIILGLKTAKLVSVAINKVSDVEEIITTIRKEWPEGELAVRCEWRAHEAQFKRLGASFVISKEAAASAVMLEKILPIFLPPEQLGESKHESTE